MTPNSPTVVTGVTVATRIPSAVETTNSPEIRMNISSLGLSLRHTSAPAGNARGVHSPRMVLTCVGDNPRKMGILRRTWISSLLVCSRPSLPEIPRRSWRTFARSESQRI